MIGTAFVAAVLSVTPVNGGLLNPPQIVIDSQSGSQDPHVDNDLAAYSSLVTTPLSLVQQIRYYTFSTATSGAIDNTLSDGGTAQDLLSDVDQGRIVFTRIFDQLGHSKIMLFDSATSAITELAPAPDSQRFGVALGNQTAVFIDFGISGNGTGEVMALDVKGSVPTRLTNDAVDDFNPAVSPDGNTITWEHCPVSGANCDIMSATRSGSVWVIQTVSATIFNESQSDTNGTQVVFQREGTGPTGVDIIVAPVSGVGAETVLEIPGDERNASIRGQLVAFEHRDTGALNSDIMVVDLANNRLFQITNTPTVNETLNDITVLSTGEVRLVWQASDLGADHINGATFSLPGVVAPDAGTPDAGSVCGARSSTLEATRFYAPGHSTDGAASFSPAFELQIPSSLPVVAGGSGHGVATLSFVVNGTAVTCSYRGGTSSSSYTFSRCGAHGGDDGEDDDDDGDERDEHKGRSHHHHPVAPTWTAGDTVSANSIKLHVQGGAVTLGPTTVRITFTEACSYGTVSSPLNAGGAPEGPTAGGCSSTSDAMAPMLAMLVFAALMLRRPTAIRLVARQERRKLPR